MDHWPDLERCKRLKVAGFPQDKSKFYWVTDHADSAWVEYSQSEFCNSFDIIAAAPLADELTEEIMKMIPVPSGDCAGDSMLIVHVFEDGCRVVVPTQTLKRIEAGADTLPNALSDLWMEMAGKEKEKEP